MNALSDFCVRINIPAVGGSTGLVLVARQSWFPLHRQENSRLHPVFRPLHLALLARLIFYFDLEYIEVVVFDTKLDQIYHRPKNHIVPSKVTSVFVF